MSKKGYKMKGIPNVNGGGGNGNGEGGNGNGEGKKETVSQPSQQVVTPYIKPLKQDYSLGQKVVQQYESMMSPMPMESPMPQQEMVRSTPLQERQSFDIQEIQKPETISFKNTAIERLMD